MARRSDDLGRRMRQVAVPVFGAFAIAYFGYHCIQGDRGLIAWWNLRYQLEQTEAELDKVSAEKATLDHRVSLLRPESLDPDMLEERARIMLGFVHPADRIVPLPPQATAK